MESKYIKYSIEQLADDEQFISWILEGNNSSTWEELVEKNVDFREKVTIARELILLLQDTSENLGKKDEKEIWNNIDSFSRSNTRKVRALKMRKSLYWAASIILFLSIGTLAYINLGGQNSSYQFVSSEFQHQNNDARLLLSDGEEIKLTTYNSKLSLISDSELMVNNDTIIDLSQKEIEHAKKLQMNEVVIPFGKKSELLLADGTKVWLNAGSRLAFPTRFDDKTRKVFLEGEAYFEVAENKTQAFIVNAGKLDIRVLGTHFNVSAYLNDERIETILLEGSVALNKTTGLGLGRNEVILKPYQKGSFDKQKNDVLVSAEPDAEICITWTEGIFQFSQEGLAFVFSKLERYYNVEINISQNFHFTELISGKLDLKESLEDVMAALSDVAQIDYNINEGTVYIDRKK